MAVSSRSTARVQYASTSCRDFSCAPQRYVDTIAAFAGMMELRVDACRGRGACLRVRHKARRGRLEVALGREDRDEPGARGAQLIELGDEALRPGSGGLSLDLGDELPPAR